MTAYNRHKQKIHGKHQRHTRDFLKVYTPYLPLLVIVTVGLVLSIFAPVKANKSVLAYSTSMSVSDLLQSTNQDRATNGLGALTLNTTLDGAAQAKANDMIAKDYWAHDPPGCPQAGTCWYAFVNNSGYQYRALGENLAYGYLTSENTVAAWMASPEHRANMLNGSYTQVGFGFTNGSNFNNSGPETVVVAEYATPITQSPVAPPAAASTGSTKAVSQTQSPATTQPAPVTNSPAETKSAPPVTTASTTDQKPTVVETPTVKVSRLAILTQGNIPWMASAITVIMATSIVALALRHAIAIRRWFKRGERYVLNHALFDITIVSLIGLCVILNQSTGLFVR